MASPVDTSVKCFTSAMIGSPSLSGTAGAMLAILSACLVDGFDTKAATSLTVSGGVATLSYAGTHSADVEYVIAVAGVTGALAALNGEQRVTAGGLATGALKFATAAADGVAAGSITFSIAPAGWTKPFTGANTAAFKPPAPSNGCSLRVDDTGTTSCRVVGYENMTSADVGTGPFPTTAQRTGGGYWAKSTVASAVVNQWVLVADKSFLILFVAPGSGTNVANVHGGTRVFGDPIAYRPAGDSYSTVLNYSATATATAMWDGCPDGAKVLQHAVTRDVTGLGSALLMGVIPASGSPTLASGADGTYGAFPSYVDGGLRMAKTFLVAALTAQPPRAELPGLYHIPQSTAFDNFKLFDRVVGSGAMAGRKFMALNPAGVSFSTTATSATAGASLVDITGPWR